MELTAARGGWWRWVAGALVAAELAFGVAGYPLLDPDEGRNAEVMREMAATNNYILPHLNGLPYLDKPIVHFAAGASVMELLGPTELAARLPSLAFTAGTILLVFGFARRRWGADAAWLAALATAATPFTLAYSRTVIFDATLTFWVVLALVGFYEAIEPAGDAQRVGERTGPAAAPAGPSAPSSSCLLPWIAMALGVLTKGPVALALPLLAAIPFALWRGRLRAIVDGVSVLLFVTIVAVWVYAVSHTAPDFLDYVLLTETIGRLTTTELRREGPWWYFLAIFPAATLPWSVLAGAWALRHWRRLRTAQQHPLMVYLALWIVVPLLLFTVSQSKRPQYVLPLVPAVGLLVAGCWRTAARTVEVKAAAGALAVTGIVLLGTRHEIAGWVASTPDIAAAIPATALALGGVCAVCGAVAWHEAARRHAAVIALVVPVAAIPFTSTRLMDAIGRYRSAQPLAELVQPLVSATTEVVAVETFPLSLPFYLRATVLLVTDDGTELTSNYLAQRFETWARHPYSPFRSHRWLEEALLACDQPWIFIARSTDVELRQRLEARLPLVGDTGRHAAYGPCGARGLAMHQDGPRRPATAEGDR